MAADQDSNSAKPDQASRDIERNMRRTLGVGPATVGHRRRFAQDGDVPVVVVRGRRDENREATEAALQAEREARGALERTLATAQASNRDLQTKLAHMEMSQSELRQSFGRVSDEKQTLQVSLADETSARMEAEARLEKRVVQRRAVDCPGGGVSNPSALPAQLPNAPPPRAASALSQGKQQPVDWWSKHENN